MSDDFILIDRLEELDALIEQVRQDRVAAALLKSVAQNPHDQTFDLQASCVTVGAELNKHDATTLATAAVPMSALLRKTVNLVNARRVQAVNSNGPTNNIVRIPVGGFIAHWLYENSTRFRKICIVRKIMSYRTLASFIGSGTPPRQKPLSIPPYILEAWQLVCYFEREIHALHAHKYISGIVMNVDIDFLALTDSDETRKQARADAIEFHEEQRTKRARFEE